MPRTTHITPAIPDKHGIMDAKSKAVHCWEVSTDTPSDWLSAMRDNVDAQVLRLDMTSIPPELVEELNSLPVYPRLDSLIINLGQNGTGASGTVSNLIQFVSQFHRENPYQPKRCISSVFLRLTQPIFDLSANYAQWAGNLIRLRLDFKCTGNHQPFTVIQELLRHCGRLSELVIAADRDSLNFLDVVPTTIPSPRLTVLNFIASDEDTMNCLLSNLRVSSLSSLCVQFKEMIPVWEPCLAQAFSTVEIPTLKIGNVACLKVNPELLEIMKSVQKLELENAPIPEELMDGPTMQILHINHHTPYSDQQLLQLFSAIGRSANSADRTDPLLFGMNLTSQLDQRSAAVIQACRELQKVVELMDILEPEVDRSKVFKTRELAGVDIRDAQDEWESFDEEVERWMLVKPSRPY